MQTPADVIKIHDVTASSAGARRRRNELLSLSLSLFLRVLLIHRPNKKRKLARRKAILEFRVSWKS